MANEGVQIIHYSRAKSGCTMLTALFGAAVSGVIAMVASGWVFWVVGFFFVMGSIIVLSSLYKVVVRPAVLELRPDGLMDLRADDGPRLFPWTSILRVTSYRSKMNYMTISASVTLHVQKPEGGFFEHKIDLDGVQYGAPAVADMIQAGVNHYRQTAPPPSAAGVVDADIVGDDDQIRGR